ncbi:MAG: FlgD immunoglobulin-like domain containing protein [Nitrososphaera sp.]|uniref:FlgD immunoglobulin-like domain containing protein n=1 Tax=Nitrososphaera sp. TaxID=1971748 RepID=UPI003170BB21
MKTDTAAKSAIVVFLALLLAGNVAYAQGGPPDVELPKQLTVALSDGFSVSDILTATIPMITRSITDTLSIDDSTQPNKASAIKMLTESKVTIKTDVKKKLNAFRFVFENLDVSDPVSVKGPSAISISNPIGITDSIELSGALAPRAQPVISLQPGPATVLSPDGDGVDDTVEISFDSTARGTYVFEIKDAQGNMASSIEGAMVAGRNSVTWDGKDSSGSAVSPGTYTYFISARSEGGLRAPPAEGDGIIVVQGPSTVPNLLPDFELNYVTIIAAVAVAAGGTALLLFMRRRKELVLYLPAAASEVIGDIKEKYPSATVEDFIEQVEGGSKLYKGVKIENPGKDDENWFTEVINKAKKLAGVDSVNVSYKGKVRAV